VADQNLEYELDADDAEALKGMVVLPPAVRRAAIERYLNINGLDATLNLFSQSLGMANAVAQNCREMSEMLIVEHCDMHPYAAENINLPTMLGACMGAALTSKCQPTPRGACHGCAYRLGSIANQCEPTTIDAEHMIHDGKGFMCHADLDEHGQPTKVCAGHAKASATQ
jgi:hypothetical protein